MIYLKFVGIFVTVILALVSNFISDLIPMHLISAGVFAMILGMFFHKFIIKSSDIEYGLKFVAKKILKFSIILMGFTLSFSQVFYVGKYSLIVMVFTLVAAFGGGYLLGKLFKMDWKLSGLISAGTGICGGSAIAAIAPTIEAEDKFVAYAISATFIFDILMVILFPIMGKKLGMSDLGFGLWAGTAINDTSSVVAAGYAFSDLAGKFSTIVKLTRTLSIIPVVLIFGYIHQREKIRMNISSNEKIKVSIKSIFPWFIIFFLLMVLVRSLCDAFLVGRFITSEMIGNMSNVISTVSKFLMVMALGAIGLLTDFKKVMKSGFKPMLHGFIISALVVVVAYVVQLMIGQV
ncbi:MAG TPA: putative sulfate exporter family transporter [Candidatus Dwaynia gallinarum]|nr:putative sulfate exporter family transporter [Candidatus Dwaynia gallinarum]